MTEQAEILEWDQPVSAWRQMWRRYWRHKLAMIGSLILLILCAAAWAAPLLTHYNPNQMDISASGGVPLAPDGHHLFGTDEYGRDYLSRALFGARASLTVGLVSMGISLSIGVFVGSVCGYFGGIIDTLGMRLADLLMSLPTFFLILTVNAYLPPSIYNVMIVIGCLSWMGVARLVRSQFLTLRGHEFVTATRALGATDQRIILGHLLPNSAGPIMVAATMGVANAILTESALSFLGMGIQPPQASWGSMLQNAQSYFLQAWWMGFFPGVLIAMTVLSLNFVGDGLRDALDPRTGR